MGFRKARFEERMIVYSNPGSRFKKEYLRKYDKDGKGYLIDNGETNIYEMIQADRESSNINIIMERIKRGDTSMINFDGFYADMKEIPENLMDAMNLQLRAEKMWDSIPVEIKMHYNNDKMQYLADFGSETFMKLHGFEPVVNEPIKEEKTDA